MDDSEQLKLIQESLDAIAAKLSTLEAIDESLSIIEKNTNSMSKWITFLGVVVLVLVILSFGSTFAFR